MHANEKKLRYQEIQKLGRLRREGAKLSTIAQVQQSITGASKVRDKAKHFRGRNR